MPKKITKKDKNKAETKITENERLPEPEFLNLEEYVEQNKEYKKLLLTFIIIAGVIVGGFWLWSAKIKINTTIQSINYEELTTEIKKSLGLLDEELKNRTEPKTINIDELEKISEQIEIELAEDISLWPTIEISKPKISLQYPNEWDKEINNNTITFYPQKDQSDTNLKIIAEEVAYKTDKLWQNWLNQQLPDTYQKQSQYLTATSTDYEISAFYDTENIGSGIIFIKFNQQQKAYKLEISDQTTKSTTTKLIVTSIKPVK